MATRVGKNVWRIVMPYANKNDPRRIEIDFDYNNSQKGFIIVKMGQIFKPSNSKLRPGRNFVWKPELSREDLKLKLSNHVLNMAQDYPETDGYICSYCKSPFTYITNRRSAGPITMKRSKSDPAKIHNFSIDRWDPTVTYTYENIRFCCLGCNNRKSSSTPNDWQNFKEAEHATY